MSEVADKFIQFNQSVDHIQLPEEFTFPFYYSAHELSKIAAAEIQEYLLNQDDFQHNFGLPSYTEGLVIGKMFGILVVQSHNGEIGYLAAFSGKLANANHHEKFVPPVHDILSEDGYFIHEEKVINQFTIDIETIENNPQYHKLLQEKEVLWAKALKEIDAYKAKMKISKASRKKERDSASSVDHKQLKAQHKDQSLFQQFLIRELIVYYEQEKDKLQVKINIFEDKLSQLRTDRKAYSGQLQRRLFNDYSFLNALGENKSLHEIFQVERSITPPAGAGECAAPKLFQYAFSHDLKPICMAEFWWGESPNSQVRKHKEFYPSCRSKCEPILGHMLRGLKLEKNPILDEINPIDQLDIIYEDEVLVAVNKPTEFLSVPGKTIKESILTLLEEKYPHATGPLLVHRLDMSTSGILIAAKTKEIHKELQAQFINRTVNKRYEAVLDGVISEHKGIIDLPLRVDLDNRPRQLVCYDHGKTAKTAYKVKEEFDGKTRILFYPITGRTHQLRVHAAHHLGLNRAIIGDDLYGRKADRLHLHAAGIDFIHPITKKKFSIKCPCPF